MKLHPWISVPSLHEERGVNTNFITAIVDLEIVNGAGIACGSGDNSEETTSLSHEIDEHMNVQASMLDICKKRRTNARSSPSIAHVSSSIAINDSSHHSFLPPAEELLETTKKQMCLARSSSGMRKPSLSELDPSLQVLLSKASMVILGLSEGISGAEATKRELDIVSRILRKP
ncbi:hypothetical protein PVK06_027711 [Gossypium arboreum]|uniref:Uncharacterized protein n=1 Tax=Gossypium arboreum TaxID=29729 RepID=A0ABR0P107_GOSAR|nr:hypothetical protein PVK06_027711 [Gossypium arboreum]